MDGGYLMYKERMIGYYPQVIQDIREFKAIVDAEYPEFEELSYDKYIVLADAYLVTMAEDRVKQWEQFLSIHPIEGSSIEDRRSTIIARIRGNGKLNTALINSIVNAFTGGTADSYIEDSVLYVGINPPKGNKDYQFQNVEQELKHRIPAHLGLSVSRNYYQWDNLKNNSATWGDVKTEFTNWEEVLLNVQTRP